MAIGVLFDLPGGTQALYEEINEKAFGDRRGPSPQPEGLIIHTAGPTESGWRVFDVWESREAFDRFMRDSIMPATEGMEQLGENEPEIYELANMIGAGVGART